MRNFPFFKFLPHAGLFFCLIICLASSCSIFSGKSEKAVAFDTLCIDSIVPLFDGVDNPVLTISVNIEKPSMGDPELVAALGEMINMTAGEGSFFGQVSNDVSEMVDAYIEDCISNYYSVKNDFSREELEGSIIWLNYEAMLNGRVVSSTEEFISYEVKLYAYNGGAHGQTIFNYSVYDLKTMQVVSLSNLVDTSTDDAISVLLRQKLAMNFGFDSFDSLVNDGVLFPDAEVNLTENFYFDEAGITWVFNEYDIAPYAVGYISVTLTWDELESLLPAESIAMRMLN